MFEHPSRPEVSEPFIPSGHGYTKPSGPRKESQQIERQPAVPTRSIRTSVGEPDVQRCRRQSVEDRIVETLPTPGTPRRQSVLKRSRAFDETRESPSKKTTKDVGTASKEIIATKPDDGSGKQAVTDHRRKKSTVHTSDHTELLAPRLGSKHTSSRRRIDSPRLPDRTLDKEDSNRRHSISEAHQNVELERMTPDTRTILHKAAPDEMFVPDHPLALILSDMESTTAEITKLNTLERLLRCRPSFSDSNYLRSLSAYKDLLEDAQEYLPRATKYPPQVQQSINDLLYNLMESDPRTLHKLNEHCDQHARYATESRRHHFRRVSYQAGLTGAAIGAGSKELEEEEKKLRIATVTEKCMLALGKMALHCAHHIERERDSM